MVAMLGIQIEGIGVPNPADTVIIYKAQSLLTKDGQVGPILSLEEAKRVVEEAEKEWPR